MSEGNKSVKILIVEDSPTQAEHLKHILEKNGYTVTMAASAKEALSALHIYKPALVISDIVMPEMDGYQLCKEIKADQNLKDIPVMLLTALSDPMDVLKGLECNADNFIIKPYDEKYLLSRIHYILINRELRASEKVQLGVEVFFSGQKYLISSERQQILDLLLSTYETAVQKNGELAKTRDELEALNDHLEQKVEERTAMLKLEIEERMKAEMDLRRSNRALKMLSGCNEILVRAKQESELLSEICRIITEIGGYRLTWIGIPVYDKEKTVKSVAQSGSDEGYLGKVNITWSDTKLGNSPTGKAIRTRQPCVVSDIHADPDYLPWRADASRLGYESLISFPLTANGRDGKIFGALTICASEQNAFHEEEVKILSELANDLSYGIVTLRTREERKLAVQQLQRERNFNQTLIQASPAFIVVIGSDGKTLFMNDSMLNALGYTNDEVIGKDYISSFVPESDREALPGIFSRIMGMKKPAVNENHILAKDGQKLLVEWHGRPILTEEGDSDYFFGVGIDITERKRAEEELKKSEEKYRSVVENIGMGISVISPDMEILSINNQIRKWRPEIDISNRPICYKTFNIPPRNGPCTYCPTVKTLQDGHVHEAITDTPVENGTRNMRIISSPLKDASGKLVAVIEMVEDITYRVKAEETMKKLSMSVEQTTDWVVITDTSGNIEYVNKAVEEITGYKRDELIGRNRDIFSSGTHNEEFSKDLRNTIRVGNPFCAIFTSRKKNGELFYLSQTITPMKDKTGEITHFVSTAKDITRERSLEDRLKYLAYYDALTGLPNRNLFTDRLIQGIARADYSKRLVAVLAVDIDRFKLINDMHGFDFGDVVLREVGTRLRDYIREGDTVGRLGNDEFGILLVDLAHTEDIIHIIEKVMNNISQPIHVKGKEIVTTISAGISAYPTDGVDAAALLKNADLAMAKAKAKQQGRRNYLFYTEDMNVKAAEFVSMERNLARALTNEEFLVFYQPYFDMNTRKLAGMEALLRWRSPEFGLVLPGKFIPVLEESGMILEVGEWILRTAVRQVKEWQNKGCPAVPVSVNLSLVQFRQKDLADMVKRAIEECGFYRSLLTLEITESVFMQDIELTKSVLKKLKDEGISISIDDFGTGYSSLSYLKRFPVDNLKIDRSFIREIATDPDTASIVSAIIAMSHSLNIKAIAEGIETEEQWKILRLLRCDVGQGFLLSRPMPPEDAERVLTLENFLKEQQTCMK